MLIFFQNQRTVSKILFVFNIKLFFLKKMARLSVLPMSSQAVYDKSAESLALFVPICFVIYQYIVSRNFLVLAAAFS